MFHHRQKGRSNGLFFLVAAIAIGLGVTAQFSSQENQQAPEFSKTILLPTPRSIGEVSLIDHQGNAFSEQGFKGKWSILFFGFTNCPDICPTTMQTLKQVKQKVSEAGAWQNYQVFMVSVDPQRDTLERLSQYVPFFDPEFTGLTGDEAFLSEFAKRLGILFIKREETTPGVYEVDHGASLILLNPRGEYAGVISAPHKVDEISGDLVALASYQGATENAKKPANEELIDTVPSKNETTADSGLQISNAWIRPAPPTVSSMAAYMDIQNQSDKAITINAVESPAFAMAMIHTTVIEDGVASMEHLDSVTVAAGESVALAPLGKHIMLMRPTSPLPEGQSAALTLIDANGQRYTTEVFVKQPQNH